MNQIIRRRGKVFCLSSALQECHALHLLHTGGCSALPQNSFSSMPGPFSSGNGFKLQPRQQYVPAAIKKPPLLKQWGVLIGWAETVEKATGLPLPHCLFLFFWDLQLFEVWTQLGFEWFKVKTKSEMSCVKAWRRRGSGVLKSRIIICASCCEVGTTAPRQWPWSSSLGRILLKTLSELIFFVSSQTYERSEYLFTCEPSVCH